MLPQEKTRLCDAEWLNCVSPIVIRMVYPHARADKSVLEIDSVV
jgi:hypothetical protein